MGAIFLEKKSACGNVPTSSGLPKIWGPFFRRKEKRLWQCSQPSGASKINFVGFSRAMPCHSKTLSERGCTGFTLSPKYFWKPLTCGYVAASFFFPRKKAPYFWKPLTCGYVAAGAFFSSENWPPIFLECSVSPGYPPAVEYGSW